MEVFEVQLIGDQSIHKVAQKYRHDSRVVDFVAPDFSVVRTDHFATMLLNFEHFGKCQ